MKAVLCKAYGPPSTLVVEEVPDPRPGDGDVRVAVRACGVNFPDSLIIEGKYQVKPPPPFAPGGEVAGVVVETGAGVSELRAGDRVVALMPWGGYAEQCVVTPAQCVKVPEGVSDVSAAALLMAYGTSYHALRDRATLQKGETLLVLGAAGGVGLAAVELGKLMGARVIAAASSDEKLSVCKAHGADVLLNYARGELKQQLREAAPAGVDVVYDPVGGAHSEVALRAMAWNGRFLVIGFAAGEIPRVPLNLPLLKGCAIVGVFWGAWTARFPAEARATHEELLRWCAAGRLRPRVSATFPLERAADALGEVLSRRVTGKVVLVPGGLSGART
jgi:NADPH2:quinone reductase